MKLNIERSELTGIILTIGFGLMLILLWNHGKVVKDPCKEEVKTVEASKIDLTALDR